MIEPTVGRIVLYHPSEDERAHIVAPPVPGKPLAAMIADVQSPSVINLLVADAQGNPFGRQGVLLIQDGEPAPEGSYAEWMPYQKGQAAKTEAAEAKLAAVAPQPQSAAAPANETPPPPPAPQAEPAAAEPAPQVQA